MPKFAAQIDTLRIPVKGLLSEGGATFPASPKEGQHYHRTDLKQYFIYLNGDWRQCDNQGVAPALHSHSIGEITGLITQLGQKSDINHSHESSDVGYDGSVMQNGISVTDALDQLSTGKASTLHAHDMDTITGLIAALDSKATLAQVTAAVNAVIDGAPGAIDTLNELAAALGDDPNFATTMTNALAGKASTSHGHALTDAAITGILALAKGGTGSSTAAGARTNLGAAGLYKATLAILAAGTWVNVTHNLNTLEPNVSFIESASTEVIILDWKVFNANVIQVKTDVGAAAGAIRICVVG